MWKKFDRKINNEIDCLVYSTLSIDILHLKFCIPIVVLCELDRGPVENSKLFLNRIFYSKVFTICKIYHKIFEVIIIIKTSKEFYFRKDLQESLKYKIFTPNAGRTFRKLFTTINLDIFINFVDHCIVFILFGMPAGMNSSGWKTMEWKQFDLMIH